MILNRGQPIIAPNPVPGGTPYAGVFLRRKDAAAQGITYEPFFSNDLGVWESGTAPLVVLAEDANYEVVAAPFPEFSGEPSPRFFSVSLMIDP